ERPSWIGRRRFTKVQRSRKIRRESANAGRAPLGALDRAAANDQVRQLVAGHAELGTASAQTLDFGKARAERVAREKTAEAAVEGMDAFKARLQKNQDFSTPVSTRNARTATELRR